MEKRHAQSGLRSLYRQTSLDYLTLNPHHWQEVGSGEWGVGIRE